MALTSRAHLLDLNGNPAKQDQPMEHNMFTRIPQGGSQEILDVPFHTTNFERVLNGDMKDFLKWLDAVQARKPYIRDVQIANGMRYRLGQFTTNRARVGILAKGVIPGIRRIATDYASNAYQTFITESTLRILEEEAKNFYQADLTPEEIIDAFSEPVQLDPLAEQDLRDTLLPSTTTGSTDHD